jgi:thioesterase domain-containing protein
MMDDFKRVVPIARSNIVRFRTSGAGLPLFCFPGSGGDVKIFREMISALPERQPIYGINMEWLRDAKRGFTVEQIATLYLDIIREVQRTGPYYFVGYSFGGLIAYEIALRLVDSGDSLGLVALLDTPNPALISSLSKTDSARFHMTYLVDRLGRYGRYILQGDIKAFTGRGLAFVISRIGGFFVPSFKFGFRLLKRPLPVVLRSNDPGFSKAWHTYVPRPYSKSLVCFRVQDRGPEYDRDPSMGWSACARGGVQVCLVPGGHVDMMTAPSSVRVIAETLLAYLDNGSTIPPSNNI